MLCYVIGPLWGKSTCHRWIPLTKASDAELWCSFWSAPEKRLSKPSRRLCDLRRHRAHYDVTVMSSLVKHILSWYPYFSWERFVIRSTVWKILVWMQCKGFFYSQAIPFATFDWLQHSALIWLHVYHKDNAWCMLTQQTIGLKDNYNRAIHVSNLFARHHGLQCSVSPACTVHIAPFYSTPVAMWKSLVPNPYPSFFSKEAVHIFTYSLCLIPSVQLDFLPNNHRVHFTRATDWWPSPVSTNKSRYQQETY